MRQLLGSLQSARAPNRLAESEESIGSQTLLEEALAGFQRIGAVQEQAFTLMAIGFHHQNRGRPRAAAVSYGEARDHFVQLGQVLPVISIEALLGLLNLTTADFTEGFDLLHNAAERFLEKGKLELARGMLSNESFEALRYRNAEYALETRMQAIAMSQQLGLTWEHAWDMWELGEIYRYMGRFGKARTYYDRSLPGFEAEPGGHGLTFYDRGLGDCAMGMGDYAEAYRRFDASLRRSSGSEHAWSMTYALRGLGDAALGLGKPILARNHLVGALRSSYERHTLPGDPGGLYLSVFAAVARLYYFLGMMPEAQRLAGYVLAHPLTWNETRRDLEKETWTEPTQLRVLRDEDNFLEFMTLCQKLSEELQALEIPN